MIPPAHITEWRAVAPWAFDHQVEQDLVISRALIELFSDETISSSLSFRGGTALHKLFFSPQGRYSEDIDLVQNEAVPIGPVVTLIRAILDPWLGEAKYKQSEGRFTLKYRFMSSAKPSVKLRLKVEINTREHFRLLGPKQMYHSVDSQWFKGTAHIPTFALEELLGTKLRALYQRSKGRDVFDLARAIELDPPPNFDQIILCFSEYILRGGQSIRRSDFEANLLAKRLDTEFMKDTEKLLPAEEKYDAKHALDLVFETLLSRMPA